MTNIIPKILNIRLGTYQDLWIYTKAIDSGSVRQEWDIEQRLEREIQEILHAISGEIYYIADTPIVLLTENGPAKTVTSKKLFSLPFHNGILTYAMRDAIIQKGFLALHDLIADARQLGQFVCFYTPLKFYSHLDNELAASSRYFTFSKEEIADAVLQDCFTTTANI